MLTPFTIDCQGALDATGKRWTSILDLAGLDKPGIYAIGVRGKPYVGESIRLSDRIPNHLRHKSTESFMYAMVSRELDDISKIPDITFSILEFTSDSKPILRDLESKYINKLNSFLGGYNMRIHNELPTQSLTLYIDAMRQTTDLELREQLKQQLLFKVEMLPRYMRREGRRIIGEAATL